MITYKHYKEFSPRILVLFLVVGILAINAGCARQGLVTERYSSEFYRVPKLLSDEPMNKNPKFIFYGDSRPGWRIQEKFIRKENWYTWKVFLFPFYEIYLLGNGLVGGINWLRYTPNYGVQDRRMVRDAIYTEAKRSKVDFIINGGDMPFDGQYPSHWEKFLKENKIERPLVLDFPFLPVIGNHEKASAPTYGLPNYEAIFDYPQFYVLDFPDVAIFVVDSNLIIDQYQLINDDEQDAIFEKWFVSGNERKGGEHGKGRDSQLAWLERELASRKKRFKIVVIHHPPLSFGKHHSDWLNPYRGRKLQQKRQKLLQLFCEQDVQVVLCSHEHYYEHNILRYSSSNGNQSEREMHFIVSGGGGVPLHSRSDDKKLERFFQNYRAEGFDVLLIKQEATYHYCLIDITHDKINIQVLEITKDAKQTPRLVDEILIPKL